MYGGDNIREKVFKVGVELGESLLLCKNGEYLCVAEQKKSREGVNFSGNELLQIRIDLCKNLVVVDQNI